MDIYYLYIKYISNANSYLFQEGTGDKYENARYAKVVLVDNKLRLIDLRDKDFKEIK